MRRSSFYMKALMLLCFIFPSIQIIAQDIPEKPNPPRLVNDFAQMLSADEVRTLENKLVSFNDSTSTQIAIVIVPTLNGYSKADYAQRLGEKWGIGKKGLNNGVLILVKPKTADSNGQVQITQGYGLEGAIPDITCGEIVDYEILPAFRNNDYFGGLDKATNTLMSLARGEFSAEDYGKKAGRGGKSNSQGSPALFGIIAIVVILILIFGKKGGSNNRHINTGGLPLWLLLSMMNSGRGSHGGSWGGFSGGGGGGGGFGGFGGGSFGGGGAGGSW